MPLEEKVCLVNQVKREVRLKHMYDIEVNEIDDITVSVMNHKGDYKRIGETFDKLKLYIEKKGLMTPDTRAFGMYYDDIYAVKESNLRSKAGFTVPQDFKDDGEVQKHIIKGEKYARIKYTGPCIALEKVYTWFYGNWLVNSRYDINYGPQIEEYLNDPSTARKSDLDIIIHIRLK